MEEPDLVISILGDDAGFVYGDIIILIEGGEKRE